jgi:hypothetical protein
MQRPRVLILARQLRLDHRRQAGTPVAAAKHLGKLLVEQ